MHRTPTIELTPTERRFARAIERHGLRGFVLAVTVVSVVLSLLFTMPAMLVIGSRPADLVIAAIVAFVVPCIVAPLSARMVGRLVQSLSQASEELHRTARTDALTGVANRRAFAEDAADLWGRREGAVTVVAMVDIDDFKSVNDRHGHAAGDLALTTLAANLTGAVCAHTASEVVGRFGGDEFVVVALVPDARSAELLGHSLRAACDLDPTCPGVTATVGWVVAGADASLDEALAQADHALYAMKQPTVRRATTPARPASPSPTS